jgi:hypothetical protein
MNKTFIGNRPNESRRRFCLLFSILPCALAFKPSKALAELIIPNTVINKIFTNNSKRVGNWMIDHLTLEKSVEVINENIKFIENISTLTNTEIRHLISEDFIDGRVINICNCIFSTKETALCILSANFKGNK